MLKSAVRMKGHLSRGTFMIRKAKRGISELVASVAMIAVTIVAGAALFGYVNSLASTSEIQVGAANAGNVNFLMEKFVIPQVAYGATGKSVTLFFYNNGRLTDSFMRIEIYGITRLNVDLVYYVHTGGDFVLDANNPGCNQTVTVSEESQPLSGFSVPVGSILSITLTLPVSGSPGWGGSCFPGPFAKGSIYSFNVLGTYGNTVLYQQGM